MPQILVFPIIEKYLNSNPNIKNPTPNTKNHLFSITRIVTQTTRLYSRRVDCRDYRDRIPIYTLHNYLSVHER